MAAKAARAAPKVKAAAKGVEKAAKVGEMVVTPWTKLLRHEARSGWQGTKKMIDAVNGTVKGLPGAKQALGAIAPKAAYAASTAIVPAIAGAYAISTTRDAYRKGKGVVEAVTEGGYEGTNFLLGGALSTYAERRKAGDNKLVAGVRATLGGLDQRILLGAGQYMKNKYVALNEGLDRSLENARNSYADPTAAIAAHGDGGAYGVKDPGKFAQPKILSSADKAKVKTAQDKHEKTDGTLRKSTPPQAQPKNTSARGSGAQDSEPTGGPRGWANPIVQAAAQEARRDKLGNTTR